MLSAVAEVVERVLTFESDHSEELMQYEVDGIHLYPVVRTLAYLDIEYQLIGAERPHGSTRDVRNRAVQIARSLLRGVIVKNPFLLRRPSADVLVLTSCVGRRVVRNGKYLHVTFDYIIPRIGCPSLVLEHPFLGQHRVPEATRRIAYTDVLHVVSGLACRRHHANRHIRSFVGAFARLVRGEFKGVTVNEGTLTTRICRNLVYGELFARLSEKIRPSLVFVEDACYGDLNSAIIKTCRQAGATVIEYQHGVLNRYHLAYNYRLDTPVLAGYQQYLPHHFLTFGQGWSDVLDRLPVPKTVIGNPYLADAVGAWSAQGGQSGDRAKRILIVSQGECTTALVKLALELRSLAHSEYEIIFKLHPSEVPLESRYAELRQVDGVKIETGSDIYACIMKAGHVVGVSSTVLFEALPFGVSIHVLSCGLSDAYIPSEIGVRFDSSVSLWRNIQEADSHQDPAKTIQLSRKYWETEWQARLDRFLLQLGI